MKLFSTLILTLISGLVAMAQSADASDFDPQNLHLNMDGKADAYSCLSEDGLRIYFTRDNSSDEIWKAERKSLQEEFKNPHSIDIDGLIGDYDVFSCWLTNDEKTIFFVTHKNENGFKTTLYKASYDEIRKSFINPVKINLSGNEIFETAEIFISGPSLTNDLSQLFVYYSEGSANEHIAYFTTTDGLNYQFISFLNNANNYCPGNLADNALSYYLTLRNENNLLVKLSRADLNSDFGNPEYFIIDSAFNSGKNYYQPFVNEELGIISLTFGLGTWESNDLAIIKLPVEKTVYEGNIDLTKTSIDSILSIEVVDEVKNGSTALTDTVVPAAVNKWNSDNDTLSATDTIVYGEFSHCTLVYEDSKVVFLGESACDDTLSFDTDDDYYTVISKNTNSIFMIAFPNPASSHFRIHYDLKTNSTKRPIFEITNLSGQIIKQFELESTSGNLEIDITALAEGLYLYKIITSDFVSPVKKLVVKR